MAKAGFYTIESDRIAFRRDGYWYSGSERIENARIALLFSRGLRRASDGSYYLQIAEERAPVDVEDTAFVVRTIEDGPGGWPLLVLNDGEREPLDPKTLSVGPENVLYCTVKHGEYRARFLRSAYYHLARLFETEDDGRSFLVIGSQRYEIELQSPGGSAAETLRS